MAKGDLYEAAVQRQYKQFTKKAADDLVKSLVASFPEADVQRVVDKALYIVFRNFKSDFATKIKGTISKYVNDIYKGYRADKTPLRSIPSIPAPTFGMPDHRAVQFFQTSDNFYLGKFITDDDTKKRITEYIKKEYIEQGASIGKSPTEINAFKMAFNGVLNGEDWKIRRVIDTTVNRMRNVGAVQYMRQAGVTTFEVIGAMDNVTCSYCEAMQGQQFDVEAAAGKYDALSFSTDTLPDQFPFLTAIGKDADAIGKMSSDELQAAGIDLPPYHPACRDSIIAVLEDAGTAAIIPDESTGGENNYDP